MISELPIEIIRHFHSLGPGVVHDPGFSLPHSWSRERPRSRWAPQSHSAGTHSGQAYPVIHFDLVLSDILLGTGGTFPYDVPGPPTRQS